MTYKNPPNTGWVTNQTKKDTMKKPKGFKNPQKVKYWSESDLHFTIKGLEEEQFRE